MEWPSKNVQRGGILQPAKCSYSPETHNFIKLLMDETKLGMSQRKKFNYFLRNGEPLPSLARWYPKPQPKKNEVIMHGSCKRRPQDMILRSGAYERERFHPQYPVMDREKEKERLQDKMAYGKEVKIRMERLIKKGEKKVDKEERNRFDQLVEEIKEREDWLKEMEEIGEGKKYRHIIEQQIQEKIREMNRLKCSEIK